MANAIPSVLGQTVAQHVDAIKHDRGDVLAGYPQKFQKLLDQVNAASQAQSRTSLLTQVQPAEGNTVLNKPGLSEMTAKQLSQHVDNFLKLLMAQLKHQDPMNPMEATDFTSQIVQFTGVEQQIAMNKKLESMISLQKHGQDLGAAYLLDRTVQVPGEKIPFDGQAMELSFNVPMHLSDGYLVIKDAQGQIVHIRDIPATGAYQRYTWNGVRDDGTHAEPGYYTTQIIAADEAGKAQTVDVAMLGKVTGVYFENGEARLVVAGQAVSADRVQAVHM